MTFKIISPPLPSKKRGLRDYQQEAYDRFKDKDSAFLAMEMRLGKTLLALRLAREAWTCRRIFIFAPKIVLLAWEEELWREGISFNNLSSVNNRTRSAVIDQNSPGVFLLNYEGVIDRQVADSIRRSTPDCCILDESTTVKNAKSKTTKFFLRASSSIKKKILLSGLPAPEDWSEIWAQCAILNGGQWMGCSNYWNWISRYATKDVYGHIFTPKQATIVRDQFRRAAYCLSRKDANLGEVKVYTIRGGKIPKRELRIYKKIQEDWEVPGLEIGPAETNYAMVVTGWLRRLCGGHLPTGECDSWKYDQLEILLSRELRGEKVVIWAAFNSELQRMSKHLRSHRRCLILNGSTHREARRKIIQAFRTSKCDTLLIQQRLGRFGLDLSCSNVSIFFSNVFNLEYRAQCEDRIVMPGKKDPLLFVDLITENTIEKDIYDGLRDKKVDAKWLVARARRMDVD